MTNRFGFWITITDTPSARFAVRMAGLPVLLIALNTFLAALIAGLALASLSAQPSPLQSLTIALLLAAGLALMLLAFALRAGRAALVPLATLLSVGAFALQAAIAPLWLLIVPTLALLLALSGLRGWLWLRRHPT